MSSNTPAFSNLTSNYHSPEMSSARVHDNQYDTQHQEVRYLIHSEDCAKHIQDISDEHEIQDVEDIDPGVDIQLQHDLRELRAIRSLLNNILAIIRHEGDEVVASLMEYIRSGASLPEINSHLETLPGLSAATMEEADRKN
jgi:hypothetical protein